MDSHNIKVDIITDKKPQDSDFVKSLKANVLSPLQSLRYTDHSDIFMYGDTFCYERMANFRNSIIEALEHNIYDALVCNTYETVQVASTMGLEDVIQIIAYTHLESQIFSDTKNPFLHSTNDMMRKQLELYGITIGTQSKFNQLQFSNALHLPIPITEQDLLSEHHVKREGVLFIGRWEEGKDPELYLELIEKTKLPARVMTNNNGAKKFEDRFKKMGITDYKIGISIIGKEKVDFITSCRVAFNPSNVESYGMAFYEQMSQMPTVCLDDMRWTKNFNSDYFYRTDKKHMCDLVTALYNQYTTAKSYYDDIGALSHTRQQEANVFSKWNTCFNEFEGKKSNTNTAKICEETTIKLSDFTKKLKRDILCIDDIKSVLTNKHKFRIIYTDDDTYLTKDPLFEPEEEGESLFSF